MKKKLLKSLSIVLCLSSFTLFAIGSSSSDESTSDEKFTSTTNVSDTINTSESTTTVGTNISEEQTSTEKVTIEKTILVDQNDIVITATELGKSLWGPELKLLIENNSDTNLVFQVRNASVNGFMANTMMSQDVAAGKKSNTEITFTSKGLKECGIDTFANIEFSFHVFTEDGWDTYFDTDIIKIETSAASTYQNTIDDSGEVLYNDNGLKIVSKGLSSSSSVFGPGLMIYIENNTDKDYTIQTRNTSINGFMIDTIMSEKVVSGKKAITAITFLNSSLEDNEISDITSIETSFHIFNDNDWLDSIDTDVITINF